GIGMLALLTLFPLGAFNMAQALNDDRIASTAAMAQGVTIAQGFRNDACVVGVPGDTTYYTNAFINPFPKMPAVFQTAFAALVVQPALSGNSAGPSHPVIVDPYGYIFDTSKHATGIGFVAPKTPGFVPQGTIGVPRRSVFLSASGGTTPLNP